MDKTPRSLLGHVQRSIHNSLYNKIDINYLINFDKYFTNTQTFFLSTNYRSTNEIIQLANESIQLNKIKLAETPKSEKYISVNKKVLKKILKDSISKRVKKFLILILDRNR